MPKTARVIRSVLVRSNNRRPSGPLRFAPGPKPPACYLTRLAAASHRGLSLGFHFRVSDGARTPSVEPVNPASRLAQLAPSLQEGPNQPAWSNLSPVARDYPEQIDFNFRFDQPVVLSMNCEQPSRFFAPVNQIISTGLFTGAVIVQCISANVHGVLTPAIQVVHRRNHARDARGE